ncbi:hypothetical protein [Tahibacter amnicola]|uniref:Lysozyme inhibitor LprI N-terminal domain-containing protein n=1 Tax=Tahibacter amnicola TaxID=2976241 RepID=A0ABY6BDH8_9GAMM|nr:hypothetical protein [Tahibacter amnicola]UXI67862.1 hypothetical protein N4264_24545 [Tahibacter amnicola]
MNRLIPLALAVAALGLAACQRDPAPADQAQADAGTDTAALKSATRPPSTKGATTTIDACDEYLSKYEACIAKLPDETRQGMQESLELNRAAWRTAASTESGRRTMTTKCKNDWEAAKVALAAYGCSDL